MQIYAKQKMFCLMKVKDVWKEPKVTGEWTIKNFTTVFGIRFVSNGHVLNISPDTFLAFQTHLRIIKEQAQVNELNLLYERLCDDDMAGFLQVL